MLLEVARHRLLPVVHGSGGAHAARTLLRSWYGPSRGSGCTLSLILFF